MSRPGTAPAFSSPTTTSPAPQPTGPSPAFASASASSPASAPSHPRARSHRPLRSMDMVGTDTFRGTGSLSSTFNTTASRMSLYSKNGGEVRLDSTGVALRVESPVSGDLLVTPVDRNRPGVRDPVAGTPLRYAGSSALVQTPTAANDLMRTRRFYISKDIDITLQTLRATTNFTRYTNEKVGTAGSATGMDPNLLFYATKR